MADYDIIQPDITKSNAENQPQQATPSAKRCAAFNSTFKTVCDLFEPCSIVQVVGSRPSVDTHSMTSPTQLSASSLRAADERGQSYLPRSFSNTLPRTEMPIAIEPITPELKTPITWNVEFIKTRNWRKQKRRLANMESLSSGHGIQVVTPSEDHTFLLDEEALQKLLMREDLRDRHVVLVSVAGAYRKGKSFLLDFFLRYLDRTYNNGEGGGEWLGKEDEVLKGFSWRGGSDRHTTGIHLWSQPFKASLANGEKVVVLLMDTQGTFDSNSTVKDNATVFALSTMLSSVQIYNLSQNIEEDDLQHLQLFMEYGRVAKDEIGGKPFQRLQFLVRDWSYPYDHPYGAVGGEQLLRKRLTVRDGQHEELQRVRQDIARCFDHVTGFLMPYPGTKVSTDPHFSGKLSDIDGEFKSCLKQLVPILLAPENLVTKKIGGQTVKARDLLNYFKSYVEVFNSEELPHPMTILQATAEANNTSASSEARNVYETLMEEVCGGTKPYLSQETLNEEHKKCLNKALHAFDSKKKMGGAEMAEKFKDLLVKDLEEFFKQLSAHNEGKNVHNMLSTPLVFLALLLVGYLLSVLGSTLGVQTVVALGQAATLGATGMLVVWLYTRLTGSGREIGMQLDDIAIKIKSSVSFVMPPKPSHLSSSYEHSNITSTHTDKKER